MPSGRLKVFRDLREAVDVDGVARGRLSIDLTSLEVIAIVIEDKY